MTALQLEANKFAALKSDLEHRLKAAELKWERDEERISRQQVELGRAKQGESGRELANAQTEAKFEAQRQRIQELESSLKKSQSEGIKLEGEVNRLDLVNTSAESTKMGIDQTNNALRTRVAKFEADAMSHAQQQDHLQVVLSPNPN